MRIDPTRPTDHSVNAPGAQEAVSAAFRQEWARIVASLIRLTGDWALAEECGREGFEAFEAALRIVVACTAQL